MRARRRWTRRMARACLRAWPLEARIRHGPAVVQTLVEELDEGVGGRAWVWWITGECRALVRSGLTMRRRALEAAAIRMSTGLRIDVRVTVRALRRSPGFTAAAVATLAVGIGGSAAVVGTVQSVLFTDGPYQEPHRLALVWHTLGVDPARIRVAAPDVAIIRERSRQLEGIAWVDRVRDAGLGLSPGDAVTHVRVASVTPDLFDLLGVEPRLGRGFSPEDRLSAPVDGGAGSDPTPTGVLVSDELWRSTLAADPDAVGRTLRLDGASAMVLGVLPPDFRLELPPDAGIASEADVWVPLLTPLSEVRRREGRRLDQDSDNTGVAIARLRPGADFESVRGELADIGTELQALVPAYRTADLRLDVRPMHEDARQHVEGVGAMLLAGAVVLLLVTSLNLTTLVMARCARRGPELSVRLALGSGRFGVARVLFLEGVLVVASGVVAALATAGVLAELLSGSLPPELARLGGQQVATAPFVWMAGGVALVLLLVLGTLPAVRLTERGSSGRMQVRAVAGGGIRRWMVGSQVALSVALLTTALLVGRSADRIRAERPGFEVDDALTFSVSVRSPDRYSGPADRARLVSEIETAVADLPGVAGIGLVGGLPLSGERWTQPYGLPGQAPHEWPENRADFRVVTSGLFGALGIRLVEGRAFTSDEDLHEDRRVAIVDRTLAERVAPNGTAVGRTLGFPLDGDPVEAEIVGVVERVRYDDVAAFGREAIYVPYRQEASRDVSFVVRSQDPSAAALDRLAASIPGVIHGIDPQLPVYEVRTMAQYMDAALAPVRFALRLVGAFALLTLLAASVGVHGVVAYEAASRERDLGLRMAMGASSDDVRALMVGRGLRVGIIGGAAGLALCFLAVVGLGSRLTLVGLADPLPWVVGSGTALALAVVASWWPAYRVSRIDAAEALRSE